MAEHWEFFRRCGRQWQNIGSSLEGGETMAEHWEFFRRWETMAEHWEFFRRCGRQWQNIGSSLEGVGDNGRTLGVL